MRGRQYKGVHGEQVSGPYDKIQRKGSIMNYIVSSRIFTANCTNLKSIDGANFEMQNDGNVIMKK